MVTKTEKIAALRREIAMREAVYPRQVATGKMKPADAEHQIAVMRAVLADYEGGRDQSGVFTVSIPLGGVIDPDLFRPSDRARLRELIDGVAIVVTVPSPEVAP